VNAVTFRCLGTWAQGHTSQIKCDGSFVNAVRFRCLSTWAQGHTSQIKCDKSFVNAVTFRLGFFVHIESEFQYIAISIRDVNFILKKITHLSRLFLEEAAV
jgi:hypothetical protein